MPSEASDLTRKRPNGIALKVMPFDSLRELNELDVQGLYVFLKSLPPRAAGGR